MLNLRIGNEVPWVGFKNSQPTNRGEIVYSPWTTRDGWTLYEAVAKNPLGQPLFFVLVLAGGEGKITAIVEIGDDDNSDTAYDRVQKAKKGH